MASPTRKRPRTDPLVHAALGVVSLWVDGTRHRRRARMFALERAWHSHQCYCSLVDERGICYRCWGIDDEADELYWEARAAYLGCVLPVALYATCRTMTRVVTRPPMRANIRCINENDRIDAARLAANAWQRRLG
jgi:hypothetical protein